MGRIILRNNGVETRIVNVTDFSTLSGETNVFVLGVNDVSNSFEQFNPDGSILNYVSNESVITGGTYDNLTGILTFVDLTGGTTSISGFTTGGTGNSIYEEGLGNLSTQRIGVSAETIGDYSLVSGGLNNTTLGDCSSIVGGSNNLIIGTTGVVNSTYNGVYNGSTFSGFYGSYSPSSTLSGLGTGATFSFYFNPPGTLSNIYVNNIGNNYVNNDTVTVLGDVFVVEILIQYHHIMVVL